MSDQTEATPKPKKVKPKSRATRWADAISEAKLILEQMEGFANDLETSLEELESVRQEYEDWKENLPENLQSSALGEKLEAVSSIEVSEMADNVRSAIEEAISTLDDAEGQDLPMGFGRD